MAHRPVGEAVHLGELQHVRVDADPRDHHATGGGAEVDGHDPDGPGPTRRAHRRKAAATPASTGTCSPVVWVMSGPQSTKTALAMCSGSTSRLRMVRWA